ncbi:MAG: hypothetical protein QOK10_1610 [Pseudonocardiales bacterium]|jgi:hypothetical protein|nr:hypothetical protein [Pseudonocardiales bacterium]
MQTNYERLRATHTVSRIHEFPAPETVTARRVSGEQVPTMAAVLPRQFHPTAQVVLDNAPRIGAMVALDGQNRVAAGKLAKPLGWDAGNSLIARCSGDRVTVTAGPVSCPAEAGVSLDSDRRLTLPPAAVGVLGLTAGAQALAIAMPTTGELILLSAQAALAMLTGPVSVPEQSPGAAGQAVEKPAAPKTRVRKRWQAAQVA